MSVIRLIDGSLKSELVKRLLLAKEASKLSFDEIAKRCSITNAYCAQLFHNQAQLKPETAELLKRACPTILDSDIEMMKASPMRSFDPSIVQEPTIYRLQEAMNHYGLSIKSLINEKFGDGVMSAIDIYVTVEKVQGHHGEDRVKLTLNGKFLPHNEQTTKFEH